MKIYGCTFRLYYDFHKIEIQSTLEAGFRHPLEEKPYIKFLNMTPRIQMLGHVIIGIGIVGD